MYRLLSGRTAVLLWTSALLAALTATPGAFGEEGHRIVGAVAEMHLKGSRALAEARRIMRPQETLADAAVWPDTIKTPAYEDGDTGPFRLEHPAQDTYHYTNVPFQAAAYHPDVPGARPSDILQTTRECVRVLRGASTSFTPREAIRMLAHLVGDIHQPLHIGSGYVNASGPLRFIEPQGATGWRPTMGGNALVYGPQDRFNLHSYWDTHIVNLAMRNDDVPAYAARLIAEVPVAVEWRNTGDPDAWPERWVNESLGYARDAYRDIRVAVYLGPDDSGGIPHRWRIEQPPGYDDRSRARIRTQLAKGGYRLAALLRAVWP
ncbi:MAG TPA: S1/P1 nuclease [Vicinamibacterales bacterium]|nr:S1/P1 nuclease [Vicinamibacterales bacterium]